MRWALLTAGGLGHLRPASGTWGSTPPPAIAVAMVWYLGTDGFDRHDHLIVTAVLVLLAVLFSIACVRFGTYAEARFGRKDPGEVVADEVAGQSIALLALPWRGDGDETALRWNLTMAAIAFIAFRIFDVTKPPPANGLQRLPGGWGILVDDLIAGVYALIATQVVVRAMG